MIQTATMGILVMVVYYDVIVKLNSATKPQEHVRKNCASLDGEGILAVKVSN